MELFNELDYKGTHYTETYWINKKEHKFLKEEDTYPGGLRYKIKLNTLIQKMLNKFQFCIKQKFPFFLIISKIYYIYCNNISRPIYPAVPFVINSK
ncbi:MAG: hypothetical protein JWQ63_2837 [Mucilaginibacter sp.]|nr:hypothetical protein [Mucilaginibacter sp.]